MKNWIYELVYAIQCDGSGSQHHPTDPGLCLLAAAKYVPMFDGGGSHGRAVYAFKFQQPPTLATRSLNGKFLLKSESAQSVNTHGEKNLKGGALCTVKAHA